MTELTLQNNSDYELCGYRGNKPQSSCIVYAPYIPKQDCRDGRGARSKS